MKGAPVRMSDEEEEEAEWRTEGSDLLGRRVRRSIIDGEGAFARVSGFAHGTIVGWLPADESDFISEVTGEPAALWHGRCT